MTRALVLGATDLVGNNVLRVAMAAGWEMVVFDRPLRGRRRRRHPAPAELEVEIVPGRDRKLEAAVAEPLVEIW